MLSALKIVGLSIGAAVLFGIVHDQVTDRLCVEYFTIGHPRIIESESPTVLGLVWGVVATWWVGLLLGVPLAVVATRGERPKRTAESLGRPIGILMLCMACTSLVAGLVGYALANAGSVILFEPMASRVPAGRHAVFIAVGAAHTASYLAGFIGGLVLISRVRKGRKAARNSKDPGWVWAVSAMKAKGIPFGPGLTDNEVRIAEETHSFRFPPDLRAFLQYALPLGDKCPDWRNPNSEALRRRLTWPAEGMCFDVVNAGFWLEEWGPKPDSEELFRKVVEEACARAPFLIPIYSHRYLPAVPTISGNPVFSIYQTDIIYYGSDLSSYIQSEFLLGAFKPNLGPVREIEFWSDLERLDD